MRRNTDGIQIYSFVLMLFGSYVLLFLCLKYELLQ